MVRDSAETSVTMGIYPTLESAIFDHILNSKLQKVSISSFRSKVDNFNPERLQSSASKAYPKSDRPRGERDLKSVKYYQRKLKKGEQITPIWLKKKGGRSILLDGAHRVVACYIEGKRFIWAYVIG